MKEAFYFTHDYNAQGDEYIEDMRFVMGWEGYGIYWALVERLAQDGTHKLATNYERIAFAMQTHEDRIKMVVENFKLFEVKGGLFWSNRLLQHFAERESKKKKAQESASKRWLHKTEINANASIRHSETDAIKERKGKERKEETTGLFDIFWELYPKKIKKKETKIKWDRLSEIDKTKAMEGIKRAIEHWEITKTEEKYIPGPPVWIHNERWNDKLSNVAPRNTNTPANALVGKKVYSLPTTLGK